MTRHPSLALGFWLGAMLTLCLVAPVQAQDTKAKAKAPATKSDRIEGIVQMIDKATKTVTVRLTLQNAMRSVIYNDKTTFTVRNKPGTIDDVKDGRWVICLGKYNDKIELIATRIDVREGK